MKVSLIPLRRGAGPEQNFRARQPESAFYETLMRVSFEHPYYNLADGACPDFSVQPTITTAALMKSLSLLFRDEGTGFAVLYDKKNAAALCNYLARQGRQVSSLLPEYWTRLSFLLLSRNPYFASISAIPMDACPTDWRYYFANMDAHGAAPVLLNTGDAVSADELLPVIAQQTVVPVDVRYKYVEARTISGETAIQEPCRPTRDYGNGRTVTQQLNEVYLNFSTVRQGKYTIGRVTNAGEFEPWQVGVYADDSLMPFAFVDLLFSEPYAGAGGVYPVQFAGSPATGTIAPKDYTLAFDARRTQWRYYVVQQAASDPFDKLRIESESGDVTFSGPHAAVLPNGDEATEFQSKQALVMQQQSPYHFRLLGRHTRGSRREQELLKRMPVSSPAQVTPAANSETTAGTRAIAPVFDANSTMYVYV